MPACVARVSLKSTPKGRWEARIVSWSGESATTPSTIAVWACGSSRTTAALFASKSGQSRSWASKRVPFQLCDKNRTHHECAKTVRVLSKLQDRLLHMSQVQRELLFSQVLPRSSSLAGLFFGPQRMFQLFFDIIIRNLFFLNMHLTKLRSWK